MNARLLAALVFFLAVIDPARACWWGWQAWDPHYYHTPYYYAPPVVYVPVYVMPAPQVYPSAAPQYAVPQSAPTAMPERKLQSAPRSAAPQEMPYAEIKPAAMSVPAEEKMIPKMELPMPKAEPAKMEVPKSALPAEPMKVEFTAPKLPEPTPAAKPMMEVPPLALPTTTPKIELPPLPSMPLPMPTKSTSNYTPAAKFEVGAVAGAATNGRYEIKFENRTSAAVSLVVQGESVTLQPKHSITATVPATFTWKLADHAAETAIVGDGVKGYVVVVK